RARGSPASPGRKPLDEALCFGCIDSVRKRIDDTSHSNRFTPRTVRSTWSAVNIKRAEDLIERGRMRPAGRKAFKARTVGPTAVYSYEQRAKAKLGGEFERQFRSNTRAWEFLR